MPFFALTLGLRDDPEAIDHYKFHHREVWPDVEAALRRAGILRMRIFLRERRLFMYLEAEEGFDPDRDLPPLMEDPGVRALGGVDADPAGATAWIGPRPVVAAHGAGLRAWACIADWGAAFGDQSVGAPHRPDHPRAHGLPDLSVTSGGPAGQNGSLRSREPQLNPEKGVWALPPLADRNHARRRVQRHPPRPRGCNHDRAVARPSEGLLGPTTAGALLPVRTPARWPRGFAPACGRLPFGYRPAVRFGDLRERLLLR